MSVTTVGTKIYMSKEPHEDLKVPPTDDQLVDMAYDATSFSITGGSVTEHDRTALGHTEKVFVAGLADSGAAAMAVFYEGKAGSSYRECLKASKDRKKRYFKRELSNGDTTAFIGFINQFDDGIEIDSLIAVNVGVKLSGGREDAFIDKD